MATLHHAAHQLVDRVLGADPPPPDAAPASVQDASQAIDQATAPSTSTPVTGGGQDGDQAGVPIGVAAAALRLSVDAVRKRVRRGTLAAYKVEDEWRVVLPETRTAGQDAIAPPPRIVQDSDRHATAPPAHDGRDADPETGQDTGHGTTSPSADPSREVLHLQELVTELRRQRDQLEGQVEAQRQQIAAQQHQLADAATERAELRRLLGNAQMQLARLLPPPALAEGEGQGEGKDARIVTPPPGTAPPSAADQPTRRMPRPSPPWWQFWRRA